MWRAAVARQEQRERCLVLGRGQSSERDSEPPFGGISADDRVEVAAEPARSTSISVSVDPGEIVLTVIP